MNKLFKYEIPRQHQSILTLPVGTRILKVGIQGDELDASDQISDAHMLSVRRGIPGVEFKVVLWALAPVSEVRNCPRPASPIGDDAVSIVASDPQDPDLDDGQPGSVLVSHQAEHGEVKLPIWSIATGAVVPSAADLWLGTIQLPGVSGQACFSIFTSKGLGVTKE